MVRCNSRLLTIIIVCVGVSATPQQKSPAGEQPDIVAINFSWSKHSTRVIRGAQNPGGPITTPMPAETQDLGSRKAELRNVDKQAAMSTDDQGNTYFLLLEFKNTGTRVVRSVIWEFRPAATPDDYAAKQYLCKLRIKPNQKKTLDLWTPYAPVKVISATVRANGLKDGEVIIHKIEYLDGSIWKRHDWRYSLPADATDRVSEGKCSVFDS